MPSRIVKAIEGAAFLGLLTATPALERFPIRLTRKGRGFQAFADWRGCGWTM